MNILKDISLFTCYILILVWMFIQNELFFKLIIILFIIGTTIDDFGRRCNPEKV